LASLIQFRFRRELGSGNYHGPKALVLASVASRTGQSEETCARLGAQFAEPPNEAELQVVALADIPLGLLWGGRPRRGAPVSA
jgi:hypothetical protein